MHKSTLITSYVIAKLRAFLGQKFYETKVGIKYTNSGYASNSFSNYVISRIALTESNFSLSSLAMPPDALKNTYTWSGKPVTESPHYQLMHELSTGTLTASSTYIQHCLTGTLDARRPFQPTPEQLYRIFALRMEELILNKFFDIFVYQKGDRRKIVIVDGKHRAALAAYLGKPHILRLNFISSEPFRHPFFTDFYSRILNASPKEYSVNQDLIRTMFSERTTPDKKALWHEI